MTAREAYAPAAAFGAEIQKEGDTWTLVLVRTMRHSPTLVWDALTDPVQLHEWAPFDVDHSLGITGPVKVSTVGTPTPYISESTVKRVEKPRLLEFTWGENAMRWELEPVAKGTKLTLWHNIDRKFISMGAAGWHICFDVLDHLLDGQPIGRMAGGDAMKFGGWHRLHSEYIKLFAVDKPSASPDAGES